jgi:hypothetical protein
MSQSTIKVDVQENLSDVGCLGDNIWVRSNEDSSSTVCCNANNTPASVKKYYRMNKTTLTTANASDVRWFKCTV